MTQEEANEMDEIIKNDCQQPYPFFVLTNNNAKIKSTKARIAQLESLKNAPKSERNIYQTNLFKVIENTDIMRLQIVFDDKPDERTRITLKSRGFKWSPKNSAWQRQLTENVRHDVKKIIYEIDIKEREQEC